LTVACGPRAGESDTSTESDASAASVAAEPSDVIVCSVSPAGVPTEYYVLPAINHKLQTYPELASAAGVSEVSDCPGARAFFRLYDQYRQKHPGFDANETRALPPPPKPPSNPKLPTLMVPKLSGGNPATLDGFPKDPVVRLTWILPDGTPGDFCTGTFIAKNWIVTAAHCLMPLPNCELGLGQLSQSGPFQFSGSCANNAGVLNSTSAIHLYGYQRLKIQWASGGGTFADGGTLDDGTTPIQGGTLDTNADTVLQIPDPKFMGFIDGVSDDYQRDFALLYLDHVLYDGLLPGNADNGSAMRVAAADGLPGGASLYVEGAGNGSVLTPFEYTSVPSASEELDGQSNPTGVYLAPGVGICHGDSGGPLYYTSNNAPILLGVTVLTKPGGTAMACSSAANDDTDYWKSAGAELSGPGGSFNNGVGLINNALQLWNGAAFSCSTMPAPGNASASIAQCWGAPCDVTAVPPSNPNNLRGCGAGEVCKGAGADVLLTLPTGVSGCAACGMLPNNCSCVVGQCIPAPPPTDDEADGGSE
jgi:hypothetical protein